MNLNTPITKEMLLRRKTLVTLAMLVIGVGGLWAGWRYLTHPPRPWLVRWRVVRYLKNHSTNPNFKADFPFPSKAEMSKAPPQPKKDDAASKGKRTGKDFDTLSAIYCQLKTDVLKMEREVPEAENDLKTLKPRLEKLTQELADAKGANSTNLATLRTQVQFLEKRVASLEKAAANRADLDAKQTALAPIVSDLWDFQRIWAAEIEANDPNDTNTVAGAGARLLVDGRTRMNEARSYETIYRVIGQELWVADRLLDSANPQHRRVGVSLAMQASRNAIEEAENGWVAGGIIQGYIWPNLDVADASNPRSPFNLENLLQECANVFRRADDMDGTLRNYTMLLAYAKTPRAADQARSQLAMAYEQAGDPRKAIGFLRQIQATNDFRWVLNRIPRLERQLKGTP